VSRALFVFDRDNWCSVFQGPEQAAGDLEAADVEADEYVAFDERGTVFRLWQQASTSTLRRPRNATRTNFTRG
jgi:hypothetical protein